MSAVQRRLSPKDNDANSPPTKKKSTPLPYPFPFLYFHSLPFSFPPSSFRPPSPFLSLSNPARGLGGALYAPLAGPAIVFWRIYQRVSKHTSCQHLSDVYMQRKWLCFDLWSLIRICCRMNSHVFDSPTFPIWCKMRHSPLGVDALAAVGTVVWP